MKPMLAALVVSVLISPIAAAADTLVVSATPRMENGKPIVGFEVTNQSSAVVRIKDRELPWNRDSASIVLVDRKSSASAKVKFPTRDHFGSGIADIQPGQTLKGAVGLDRYVVEPANFLRSHEALVFWYYDARD